VGVRLALASLTLAGGTTQARTVGQPPASPTRRMPGGATGQFGLVVK